MNKFKYIYIFFGACYLSLCLHLPQSLYARAALDDALFSTLGQNILSGHWLGPYDNTVLAKGPAFPIFLALNSILGFPITLSMALLYLFSCYLVSQKLYEMGVNKYFQLVIFLLVLFHPYLLGYRVTRDAVYPSLVLLLICFVIDLFNAKIVPRSRMLSYGVIFGIFWCTREEGIWVLPSMMMALLIHAFLIFKDRQRLSVFIKSLSIFIVGSVSFILLICSVNYFKYGTFQVVDFKGNEYSRALNNIYGVSVGDERPFLAVPEDKRLLIYSVSPAFEELRDYFENEGLGWTIHGCSWYPHTCGDYATGWFNWALRSAVASKGYYRSAEAANDYYMRLNNEIERACQANLIACKNSPISFLPPLPEGQINELPEAIKNHLKLLFLITNLSEHGGPSNQPLAAAYKLRHFLGNPASTLTRLEELEDSPTTIRGWIADKKNRQSLMMLKCGGEDAFKLDVKKENAKDLVVSTGLQDSHRFLIKVSPSQSQECSILLGATDIQISEIIDGNKSDINRDGYLLHIDEVTIGRPMKKFKTALAIKRFLTTIYQGFLPALTAAGLIALLICTYLCVINKMKERRLILICYLVWGLIATRIFLLSMIEISLYKTHAAFYQTSIFSLLILALLIPLVVLLQKVSVR